MTSVGLFRPTILAVIAWAVAMWCLLAPAQAQRRLSNISVDAGEAVRGGKSEVTVNLSVGRNTVTMRRLSVRVRGSEVIELSHTIAEEKDSKGKQVAPPRTVNVRKEEVLFEREFTVVAGKELDGNSHHKFSGYVELPPNVPPSATGRYSRIKWEIRAETDMPGGFLGADPTTSWQPIDVR
jgi:hypothetical protein